MRLVDAWMAENRLGGIYNVILLSPQHSITKPCFGVKGNTKSVAVKNEGNIFPVRTGPTESGK